MIDRFKDEYFFLSNFCAVSVLFRNIEFPSVENAYQAAKCLHHGDMHQFAKLSAGGAKA